jgi:integrase
VEQGLSHKTINNHLTVLRKCLQTACDWGRLQSVPKVVWLRSIPSRRDFLTIEESTILTTAAASEPEWYAMILLGLRTGMRLGELIGLEWGDVDFQQSVITISRSIVEGIVSSPKTHRERRVAFPFSVGVALKALRPSQGLIFHRPDGRPLSHGISEHALNRTCKRAGLRHIGWHTLRHTCASQLAQLRGNSLEAQRILGHTSIAMTERYTHIVPSTLHDAVAELDAAAALIKFGQPVGNTPQLEDINDAQRKKILSTI